LPFITVVTIHCKSSSGVDLLCVKKSHVSVDHVFVQWQFVKKKSSWLCEICFC